MTSKTDVPVGARAVRAWLAYILRNKRTNKSHLICLEITEMGTVRTFEIDLIWPRVTLLSQAAC
jgi:hypothetical protein